MTVSSYRSISINHNKYIDLMIKTMGGKGNEGEGGAWRTRLSKITPLSTRRFFTLLEKK